MAFNKHSHRRLNWYAELVIAVLVVVLIVLSVFLVREYRVAARRQVISAERLHFANLVEEHSLGTAEVDLIEPWMTFDYVSVSFKVPLSYLTTVLGVASSTPRYPNITLAHYARMVATSSEAFTEDTRSAIQNYLTPTGN